MKCQKLTRGVALIFLAPFIGYTTAALTNNKIHMNYGQLGIAIVSPISKLVAYVTVALHPPWPVIVVVLMFSGFGNGLQDSGWNACKFSSSVLSGSADVGGHEMSLC